MTCWKVVTSLVICAAMFFLGTWLVKAAGEVPPGPDRYVIVKQDYLSYEWWLTGWEDNQPVCMIKVDHEGMPSGNDIKDACGTDYYEEWVATKSCEKSNKDPSSCEGYYLLFIKSTPAQRDVGQKLPEPVVWVTLRNCMPYNSTFICDDSPVLVLTGEEPLTGEHITTLSGWLNGQPFTCDPICQVDLVPTESYGLLLEFWANSSYGDTSLMYKARVRVSAPDEPNDSSWYVDILSSQWRGPALAGCSQTWDTFPPIGGVPAWLSTPAQVEDLATDVPYEYLAANLIKHGGVNTSICPSGGLLSNGSASTCGLEMARSAVSEWQNRFDSLILDTANQTGIPARLLKSIFRYESQFWPGETIGKPEAGLGQMTNGGADATLLWNLPFSEQFCSSVLGDATCSPGYAHLSAYDKEFLQKALVENVNADCQECPLGIDMQRADESIGIFAETMLANCAQAGMVLDLNDGTDNSIDISYEDLWRFTLVNYNAGPGCLGLAVDSTRKLGQPLDWENVSSNLTPVCVGAIDYVTSISNVLP